jgi:hypothetical protein
MQLVADYYGFFRRHTPVILQVVAPALDPNLLPDSPTLNQHLEFIKVTFDKEDERKASLEGKAGQLLGQAGLVLSLVAILTPLIADSLAQLPKPPTRRSRVIYGYYPVFYQLGISHGLTDQGAEVKLYAAACGEHLQAVPS